MCENSFLVWVFFPFQIRISILKRLTYMEKTMIIQVSESTHDAMKGYQKAMKSLTGQLKPLADIATETLESGLTTLKERTRAINANLEQIAKLKIRQ